MYGAVKGYALAPIATATAVNCGIAGATFFSALFGVVPLYLSDNFTAGFREYVVGPILTTTITSGQFSRRRKEILEKQQGESELMQHEQLGWWDMRADKVPDTALSGALTGGVLNAWKRA